MWTDVTPASATGWTVYETLGGGVPYGILAEPDRVWVTDQLYQQLVRIVQGLAAPHVTVRIPSATTNVELTWNAVGGATVYRVWLSDGDPYFSPVGTPAQEDATTTFTHSGVATDTDHNYFYFVRAANAQGAESVDSNRTGKFTFSLIRGGS